MKMRIHFEATWRGQVQSGISLPAIQAAATAAIGSERTCGRPHRWKAVFRYGMPAWAILLLLTLPLAAMQGPAAKPSPAKAPSAAAQSAIQTTLGDDQTSTAARLLQNALHRYPDWREGWWQMGSLAYEENDYLGGRLAFNRLAQLDPKAGAPWVMLGLCDFELRDFGLSLIHIQKGRALGFPKNPQLSDVARFHQALDFILLEDYEQAGFILDSFAREDHPSNDVLIAEGLAALHIPALEPLYQRTVDSGYFDVVRDAGKAQFTAAQQHPEVARKDYLELLRLHPDFPGLHYAFGALLTRWGELKAGIEQFQAELKRNPNDLPSHLQIGFSLFKLAQFDSAKPEAALAVRLAPSSFPAHFLLGQILLKQGQLQQAVEQLEAARDLQPDSSQVHYALAQAYVRLHRTQDAAREKAEFLRLQPIENSMIQRGTLPASFFATGGSKDSVASGQGQAAAGSGGKQNHRSMPE